MLAYEKRVNREDSHRVFQSVSELEIRKEEDTLILRLPRPSWTSLQDLPPLPLDDEFLVERPDVIEEGRFDLSARAHLKANLLGRQYSIQQ